MSKLIPMKDAANILGMTLEQLTELRSNNEIFGYRDGSNWKFKMSEIQRVADERGIKISGSGPAPDASDSFGFDLSDSFKVTGEDGEGDADSIDLADSGILSNDVLDSGELSFGSSSLSLASGSSKKMSEGESSDILDEEPEKSDSPSDTGKMAGDNGDDELFSEDLSLADSASFEESAELSSDFEESPLILDDSDSSQEISLESNDAGIDLSANESGLSLSDEPLELGGSDIDSLELSDHDEIIALDDPADQDAAAGMLQEDDFNLTPLEASLEEDESSGSQVIALEDSEIYADDSAATILGDGSDFGAQPSMLDDVGFQGAPSNFVDPSMAPMATVAGSTELPEAPYSIWQVLSLGMVALFLLTGGMIAYNLAQNMWMPNDQVIGSGVLNFFLRLTNME